VQKVYRVDMSRGRITSEDVKPENRRWGQRGSIAKIMDEEVNARCDPLGSENKLIVSTGIFAGTQVPSAHRLSIGGKSPLTNGIKESNVGGNAATYLARHGIKEIIVDGLPSDESWYLLRVDSAGGLALVNGDEYLGLDTYELCERLYETYGKDVAIVAIGPAGERQYKIAAVMVSDHATKHPCRAAGRGGLGAVMGSKHIKAIVIERASNRYQVEYADKEAFDAANKKLREIMRAGVPEDMLYQIGTIGLIDYAGGLGIVPVRNFSGATVDQTILDGAGAAAFLAKLEQNGGRKNLVCQPGCLVQCHNSYRNANGEFVTGALEYETVALLGPNCGIGDLDFLAEMDRVCDEIGVDTIEAGNIIAVCMDAGKLAWGDAEATRGLMQELANDTGFGRLMGMGVEPVAHALGAKRIPTVKGQGLAAYDPRNFKAMGVTYTTTPMGADHTAGHPMGQPECDYLNKVGQVALSRRMQVLSAMWDNMGCSFNLAYTSRDPDILPELMAGLLGGDWTSQDVKRTVGMETLIRERRFNQAAGLTAAADRLPDFMYTEKSVFQEMVFDIGPEELAEAYDYDDIVWIAS